MRCNNCGWDNEQGASTCAKCGSPILSKTRYTDRQYAGDNVMNSKAPEMSLKATVVSSPNMIGASHAPQPTVLDHDIEFHRQNLRTTIVDSGDVSRTNDSEMRKTRFMGNGGYADMDEEQQIAPSGDIPKNVSPAQDQSKGEVIQCENCHAELSASFVYCPMCGAQLPEKSRGPVCTLTLIPDEGEQIDSETIEYEGKNIVLNRANTEKANHTITSREQAVIINEEGRWFIENHSEMCSTYFEVNRKLELRDGDIIMLGDRRFKFETK